MNIEIDQSGKIESTNVDTVIAYTNHNSRSIIISAHDKRAVQTIYRDANKPHIFIYRTFAILIFFLIRDQLKNIQGIVIDEEYPGWHFMIKNFLLQEIRKVVPSFDKELVSFKCIGKKSRAHKKAYTTAIKKQQPDMVATARDIARFIIK